MKEDLWKTWNDFAMALLRLKKAYEKHSELWVEKKSTVQMLPASIQKYLLRPEFNQGRFENVVIEILEWTRGNEGVETLLVAGRAEQGKEKLNEKEKENA